MKRSAVVDKIARTMHENHPDAETFLYGSEARGDARPDSDFDILVLLNLENEAFRAQKKAVANSLLDVEIETGSDISTYIVPRAWWENQPFVTPFYSNVVRDGIRL